MTVYVLSSGTPDVHKIGFTENWPQRLGSYQKHAPDDAVLVHVLLPNASLALERLLHHYFNVKREGTRDWFRLDSQDLALIRSLTYLEVPDLETIVAHWPSYESGNGRSLRAKAHSLRTLHDQFFA